MSQDAADQLRNFIDRGEETMIPVRRLVLKLTARIADPEQQGNLNHALNMQIDALQKEPWRQVCALRLLEQVLAAGKN